MVTVCGVDGVVNVLERRRPVLEQRYFIIQTAAREVHRPPLDVKDAVGRGPCCGREDSVRFEDSLVDPIRSQHLGSATDAERRWAGDAKADVISSEGHLAGRSYSSTP